MNENGKGPLGYNRRDFLKSGSFASLMSLMGGVELFAQTTSTPTEESKPAALKAGKHVYSEAPLAGTIEDAREIARAARDAKKQIFQAGLQMRSHPQRHFLRPYIRSGALGKSVLARAQWHRKQSWRTASSDAEHEKALNWRLSKATSTGLIGEIGIHQIDQASWFLGAHPRSITGFSSLVRWGDDG